MMREMIVTLAPFISIALAGAVLVAASARTERSHAGLKWACGGDFSAAKSSRQSQRHAAWNPLAEPHHIARSSLVLAQDRLA
jgi:hypothetical protein